MPPDKIGVGQVLRQAFLRVLDQYTLADIIEAAPRP
jgi:DNA-binding IscR family transcriptional regulator